MVQDLFTDNKNPGPGHYSSKGFEMDSKGKYFISTMRNSGCR
jgi:hypothetical protein